MTLFRLLSSTFFLWFCLQVLEYETRGLCVHSVGSNATARGVILRLRYAGGAPDRRRRWRQQSRPMRRDAATHGRCRLDDDRCQSAAERWSRRQRRRAGQSVRVVRVMR